MTDLRTELQSTLGSGYTLERELGGGGMSRVFVARENALELSEGITLVTGDAPLASNPGPIRKN